MFIAKLISVEYLSVISVKILDSHTTICDFMEGSDLKDKMKHLFQIVAELRPLLYANRFLSEDEISKVCTLCDQLGKFYPLYLPQENLFRKVHELVCTVPRFGRKHGTIGLFSAQSSESLHSAVNMEARSLSALPSKTEQLRLQLERQELRTNTDKSLGKRESRLCPKVHSGVRSSFLTYSDREKHCPLCEPMFF